MIIDSRKIHAVFMDMDGTMIDSMGMWRDIDIEFCRRHGFLMPDTLQKDIEGLSFYQTAVYIKKLFSMEETPEQLMSEWNEMARHMYLYEIPLKPHVKEFLTEIKRRNMKLGIATSNSRELAILVLQSHGIEDYFDCILTAGEVREGKPAPDIYLQLAKETNMEPEHCMVFEDIIPGIMAGKRAGMMTVAVEDTYSHDIREEKQQLADYFIDSYDEIQFLEMKEDE